MQITQRTALRESGFTEAQTNALALALEPLATKEDLRAVEAALRNDMVVLRNDMAVLHIDLRWMKWIGGAIGLAVLAELVGRLFL